MQRRIAHAIHEVHHGSGAAAQVFQATNQAQQIDFLCAHGGGGGEGDRLHPLFDGHVLTQSLDGRLKEVRVDVEQAGEERAPPGVDALVSNVGLLDGGCLSQGNNHAGVDGQRAILDHRTPVVLGNDERVADNQIDLYRFLHGSMLPFCVSGQSTGRVGTAVGIQHRQR